MTYATAEDVVKLGRTLTADEQKRCNLLCETASAKLRLTASKYGKNLDEMIAKSPDLALAVKDVVVRAVIRAFDTSKANGAAVSQMSQSGLGFSAQMSFANAGQNLYFLRNELKELGIMRQRWGAMEVF